MSKYKLFPLVIGIVVVSFLTGTFVYLKFLPAKITCPAPSVSSAPVEENQPVAEEEKLFTYQNRKFGFEFKYSSKYVAFENDSPIIEANDFFYPPREANILKLQALSKRDDYGKTDDYYNIYIYAMKKGDDLKIIKTIINEQAQLRRDYEYDCAKAYPDSKSQDFKECTSYSGGWSYATTTFAGVDAIRVDYSPTDMGNPYFFILIPTKGIIIRGEHPEVLQDFTFIDKDRTITDKATGFSFNCPANWMCNHDSSEEYGHLSMALKEFVPFEKYTVKGPDEQFLLLSFFVTTTQAINNAMGDRKSRDSNSSNETVYREETFCNHAAFYGHNEYGGSNISYPYIYVPDIGLFIQMENWSVQNIRELEKKLFTNATVSNNN